MTELYQNIKRQLKGATAGEALKFISELAEFSAFSTSLGQEDQVITHLIANNNFNIEVFTLDTGRLFPETYDLITLTHDQLGVDIKIKSPQADELSNMYELQGINGFRKSVENRLNCCKIRKIEPLKRALKNKKIWVTGLRSSQSENRANIELVQWDPQFEMIKINPLFNWSFNEVLNYLNKFDIPYNPLHNKGFVSIGCQPCTRAIKQGENPRAGRWWWEESKKECGLHQHNSYEKLS